MSPYGDPVLVSWEPRWTAPVVTATCPACGERRGRSATAWQNNIHNGLTVRLPCHADYLNDPACHFIGDATIPVSRLTALDPS